MSILVVGSVALDSVKTPFGETQEDLGGSATHFTAAASFFSKIHVIGVVGSDFPAKYNALFERYKINGDGLTRADGRTFRWKGRYDTNLQATTLSLDLGVFSSFQPRLTPVLRRSRYAFLGNIHPTLQWRVLRQLVSPKITACDSRADWIETQRRGFLKLLKNVDMVFLNDSEARLLTGIHGLVQATRVLARLGPQVAIVKKGEHGVMAASKNAFFSLPGYPVSHVVDPTGAGDAFAGACLGYLTTQPRITWAVLCQAVQYASAVASITIESFGPARLLKASREDASRRVKAFQPVTRSITLW